MPCPYVVLGAARDRGLSRSHSRLFRPPPLELRRRTPLRCGAIHGRRHFGRSLPPRPRGHRRPAEEVHRYFPPDRAGPHLGRLGRCAAGPQAPACGSAAQNPATVHHSPRTRRTPTWHPRKYRGATCRARTPTPRPNPSVFPCRGTARSQVCCALTRRAAQRDSICSSAGSLSQGLSKLPARR